MLSLNTVHRDDDKYNSRFHFGAKNTSYLAFIGTEAASVEAALIPCKKCDKKLTDVEGADQAVRLVENPGEFCNYFLDYLTAMHVCLAAILHLWNIKYRSNTEVTET